MAARTARYKASSPEEMEMFLTKILKVPNIAIEVIIFNRGVAILFIVRSFSLIYFHLLYCECFNESTNCSGKVNKKSVP